MEGLQEIRPEWRELKDYAGFYRENKSSVDRVIEIIDYRIERVRIIVNKMENHQWLDDSDRRFIDEDSRLNDEQNALSEKLNDPKHKSLYIKMAKDYPREILANALSFVLDSKANSKARLFMWKVKVDTKAKKAI